MIVENLKIEKLYWMKIKGTEKKAFHRIRKSFIISYNVIFSSFFLVRSEHEGEWEGTIIKRGRCVIKWKKMKKEKKEEIGISIQQQSQQQQQPKHNNNNLQHKNLKKSILLWKTVFLVCFWCVIFSRVQTLHHWKLCVLIVKFQFWYSSISFFFIFLYYSILVSKTPVCVERTTTNNV